MFVLALMPLILIKDKAAYELSGSKLKINHLIFMDDLKLYSCHEKELDSLVQTIHIFNKDIGMEFGIEKCAMLVIMCNVNDRERKDCEISWYRVARW